TLCRAPSSAATTARRPGPGRASDDARIYAGARGHGMTMESVHWRTTRSRNAWRVQEARAMGRPSSVEIVEEFWAAVWKARNPEAIDRFVVDDVVLTTGGVDVVSKDTFKAWVKQFLEKITDFEFESVETFLNGDGSRVASRWRDS